MPPLGVHVIGAGSIGLMVAWHLRHAKVPVTLLFRNSASAEIIRAAGNKITLEYTGIHVTERPSWLKHHANGPPDYHVLVERIRECGTWHAGMETIGDAHAHAADQISQLVVATKGSDTVSALLSVRSRLSPTCQILLLQNGMLGLYKEIFEKVISQAHTPPGMTLIIGSVTHGAYRRGPAHVVQSCTGAIKLAPVDSMLPDLMHPGHQQAWVRLHGSQVISSSYTEGQQHQQGACDRVEVGHTQLDGPIEEHQQQLQTCGKLQSSQAVSNGHADQQQQLETCGKLQSSQAVSNGHTDTQQQQQQQQESCRLPEQEAPQQRPVEQQEGVQLQPAANRKRQHSLQGSEEDEPLQQQQQQQPACSSLLQLILSIPGLAAELVPSHPSLLQQLHQKLAVNCAVNPGTALLGCFNDAYTGDAWGQQLVHSICSELFGLYGQELLGVSSAEQLSDLVLQVASGTGKNKNSMLQDVLAGRPTEVDYLNGYVARWAEQHGNKAPVNSLLYTLIKAKESMGEGMSGGAGG